MHVIWRRESEFEDFAKEVASSPEREKGRLYSLVAAVETYFEFVCKVFLGKFKGRSPKQRKSINKLHKRKIIDREARDIMCEVRELRDDMLHDLFFEPDIGRLRRFKKKCFSEDLNPADEYKCKDQGELERMFTHEVTKAYAGISSKYKSKVDIRIKSYIESLSV